MSKNKQAGNNESQSRMVSIDFWDTLVDAAVGGNERRKVRFDALREIASEYITEMPTAQIEAAAKEASEEFNRVWFNQQRTPKTEELVKTILNTLGIPATQKELDYLVEVFEESLFEGQPAILDGAGKAINALSGNYQLTLISDTMYSPGRVIRNFLKNHELFDYFDSFLFSDEAGYSKPNPNAFRKMLADTGCEAEGSYHIGDRLNTDISGAKKVGMKAILFTGVSMKSNGSDPSANAEPDHECQSWQEVQELLL
ncbi:HAD family hydrolase [Balneolaceae bacterium YR4-1]|uniref:HAD family hydrolase n=1 Tax=Halalkalibaculum roseum TaxID=2709311 RepID=A0A6M1T4E8_9BACT|nr:HAD family hydrolase [Halalkalibaculum roseum]NGP75243.1 HAD family hydrolase [Halalkalibaculum roseum]